MPRGAKTGDGIKRGRRKGSLNKRTIERLNELSREASEPKKKRATEVLNELMVTALGFAAKEQRRCMAEEAPGPDGNPRKASEETVARFWKAMEAAGVFARALAPFQSPTFKAIAVVAPADPPKDVTPTIDQAGNVVRINDPAAAARLYQQMVRSVR
jgi:hypothetical protein